ncbi:TMEM165/GDT1 family protein [Sphingomonas donggukensis]|uniref:TMEM165/GDT1 family protein n=1 Tax=Sphingomonas donggukensis TaxID=2949093 RepID=A0ABY4TXC3_9SPHN|nr:TMEM165/GDT1 family protein [Sphingomonas donggukensis]URW75799.1 TMEM165/GDT1 family protein [Sphingomonas donggukensis]
MGGALVAPLLSPNAKAFLLALALLFVGIAALFPARAPGWSLRFARGGPVAAALGTSALALGDRTAFIAFALAARGPSPALAVAGALGGAIVVAGAAMTRRLPTRALSVAGGVLLAATGAVVALGALRLI